LSVLRRKPPVAHLDTRRGVGAWKARIAVLAVVLAAPTGSAGAAESLKVEATQVLPVPELSALELLVDDPAVVRGLAAGDSDFRVVRFQQGSAPTTTDIGKLLGGKPPSQWEAVAGDGAGNICLLAETSSRIECLDKDLRQKLGEWMLDPSKSHELKKSWEADPNSRGEGMVLLKRGHLLLLKEKHPSLLVEFGPSGEMAMGFGPESILAPGEVFAFHTAGSLAALKVWSFASSLVAQAHDGSDLALGPDHRLYLLSDESRSLVRLEAHLKPEESKLRGSAFWKLPRELKKPEGLAIDKAMHPWVVVDQKQADRPALFRLSPIPAAKGSND
jgi:hypothetical protein